MLLGKSCFRKLLTVTNYIPFSRQGKEDEAIHYDDKAIDELLDRSKEGIEQKENWANEYLSSFKVASYVTKEGEDVSVCDDETCSDLVLKEQQLHFVLVLSDWLAIYEGTCRSQMNHINSEYMQCMFMVLHEVIQYCCTQIRYRSTGGDSSYGHCRNREADILHSFTYRKFQLTQKFLFMLRSLK